MKKQKTEIDEILHQGKLEDSVKILQEEAADCFIIYIDKDKHIKIVGTVDCLTALGMLEVADTILNEEIFSAD